MIGSLALDSANRKIARITRPIRISPPTSESVQFASWPEHERNHAGSEQRDADVVEISDRCKASPRAREHRRQHDERCDSKRHVDVEDPVPADVVGDPAADKRTDDEAESENSSEESLEPPAFARTV